MTSHDIVKELHTAHLGVPLTLFYFFCSNWALGLMGVAPDVREMAASYARIRGALLQMKGKLSEWNISYYHIMIYYVYSYLVLEYNLHSLKNKIYKSENPPSKQTRMFASDAFPLGLVSWASLAQGVCLSAILATRDAVTPLKVVCTAAVPWLRGWTIGRLWTDEMIWNDNQVVNRGLKHFEHLSKSRDIEDRSCFSGLCEKHPPQKAQSTDPDHYTDYHTTWLTV